ncbi:hypothetical protein MNB_SM-4-1245 [hydrothermal vent metagenome]|uniref:Uncharacterized protein n=1 Tax=hydrothermal vent metagenome TaxID=652676 RepID=A0A1W1CM39_9ZZZZ
MNLWLDIASEEKIEASVRNPIALSVLEKYLSGEFLQELLERTLDGKIYAMGLSGYLRNYEKLSTGDELLITITGDKYFRYYAQVSDKVKSQELATELWPFQKSTNIVYVYFLTEIKSIEIKREEILNQLGYSRKTFSEALLVCEYAYSRYGKVYERQGLKLDTLLKDPTIIHENQKLLVSSHILKDNTSPEIPIKEGDIILTRGRLPISDKIVFFQNLISIISLKFKYTKYSHISIGVSDGVALEATVSASSAVRFISYDELLSKKSKYFTVYRRSNLSHPILTTAKFQIGRKYTNIITKTLSIPFEKMIAYFNHKVEDDYETFCSALVAEILRINSILEITERLKSRHISPAYIENRIKSDEDWKDITLEVKSLMESKYQEKNQAVVKKTIKSLNDYSEQESVKNQINEWNSDYPEPNEIPLWEQLKILNRVNDKSYSSYKIQKQYTDFLYTRNRDEQ